jgi:hypothetical protein
MAVEPTSVSLLDRLKAARPEDIDWERLQKGGEKLRRLDKLPTIGQILD